MNYGMVTYNMGKDMDLAALIQFCLNTEIDGVELRTTHAHGVELSMTAEERHAVRRTFEESEIEICQYGTACEYDSPDPAVVKQNIEESIAFCKLAADIGAPGIKVRPNRLHEGVPVDQTVEQIGRALREVGEFGAGIGVEIRVECHGRGTSDPPIMKAIMDAADHENVVVNWNSNAVDMDDAGSIAWSFELLKDRIRHVHITDIGVYQYPWQELFDLLKSIDYQGYVCSEIQYNPDPERFMRYYRTLYDMYIGDYRWPRG